MAQPKSQEKPKKKSFGCRRIYGVRLTEPAPRWVARASGPLRDGGIMYLGMLQVFRKLVRPVSPWFSDIQDKEYY